MLDFIAKAEEYTPSAAPEWLQSFRDVAAQQWRENTLPTRKTENWKYLNLRALESASFTAQPTEHSGCSEAELNALYNIPALNGVAVVFVNGCLNESLSALSELPEGIVLERLSVLPADAEAVSLINSVVDTEQHLFSQLNTRLFSEGVCLRIKQGTKVSTPIQLVNITTSQPEGFTVSPRLLVVAEPNSEATIIEHYCSDSEPQNCFVNAISELILQDNARLNFYRLQLEQENALHIGGVHVSVGRDANLNAFCLMLGSLLQRLDLTVNYAAPGGHATLNGVYLPRGNQQVDCHTCVEHAVPHCTTDETFRGIISDSAKAVFNGRIHIHRDAQKTLAQLSNKNLLTSNKAEVDTKPELEIYADDVQCAHGATIAQLDEQSMHYLTTRGVSRDEAKVMLSFGFINELIGKVKHDAISQFLRPVLAGRFATRAELVRHLL